MPTCEVLLNNMEEFLLSSYLCRQNFSISQLRHSYALHYACKDGSKELVEIMLRQGHYDVNKEDDTLKTPLHFAVLREDLDVIELLIKLGASVNVQDKNGNTPLHMATTKNKCENVIKKLLESGGDVNIPNFLNNTPLHHAVIIRNIEAVEQLLVNDNRYLYINAKSNNKLGKYSGHTALFMAVENNDLDIVKYLLSKGADVNIPDNGLFTPLHFASFHGYADIVMLLLDFGADKESENPEGWRPLHCAASNGHTAVAKLLLGNGAQIDPLKSFDDTPLIWATYKGHTETAMYLVDMGASLTAIDSYFRETAIEKAKKMGNVNLALYMEAKLSKTAPESDV